MRGSEATPFVWGCPRSWAVLPTALLVTFPLLTEYVLIFEQALLPVSLTLGALGWSLLALDRFDPLRILALTWVLCLLTASYTPSLAGAVLFFVLLLQGAFRLLREPGSLGLRSGEDPAPRAAGFLLAALTLGSLLDRFPDGRRRRRGAPSGGGIPSCGGRRA